MLTCPECDFWAIRSSQPVQADRLLSILTCFYSSKRPGDDDCACQPIVHVEELAKLAQNVIIRLRQFATTSLCLG